MTNDGSGSVTTLITVNKDHRLYVLEQNMT